MPYDEPYEEDEWYSRGGVHHMAGNHRRRLGPLDNSWTSHGVHRSRSQGHGPAPSIHIYNRADPHMANRAASRSSASPSRTSPVGSPSRGRPDYRTAYAVENLGDEMYHLRQDLRSRSRGRSDAGAWRDSSLDPRRDWALYSAEERLKAQEERERMALYATETKLKDREARERAEAKEQALRRELALRQKEEELERLEEAERLNALREKTLADKEKADAAAEERERRAVLDWKEKQRKQEEKEKAAVAEWQEKQRILEEKEKAAVAAYNEKERKRKEAEAEQQKRAVEEWQRKKREEAEEKDRLKLQFELEDEARKRKQKEEREAFKRQIEREEEEEKQKKKAAKQKLEEEMHRKLAQFGFQENQISAMIDPKKAEKLQPGQAPTNALMVQNVHHQPTFVKVHRNDLSIDTLRYYNLPWEYDRADSDYIIILREMNTHETDILFEHTKRLRQGSSQLFIEDRGRDRPEYAFVRKRTPSRSRSRVRDDKIRLRLF